MWNQFSDRGIHPNALVVLILGALVAVWIAGTNASVVGGVIFLALAVVAALAVHSYQSKHSTSP